MCYNCGCFNPTDDMGHPDNITEARLKEMAGKKELEKFKKELLEELKQNNLDPKIEAKFAKASKAWGQSEEEAKRNAKDLLESQVK